MINHNFVACIGRTTLTIPLLDLFFNNEFFNIRAAFIQHKSARCHTSTRGARVDICVIIRDCVVKNVFRSCFGKHS